MDKFVLGAGGGGVLNMGRPLRAPPPRRPTNGALAILVTSRLCRAIICNQTYIDRYLARNMSKCLKL